MAIQGRIQGCTRSGDHIVESIIQRYIHNFERLQINLDLIDLQTFRAILLYRCIV